MIAIDTPILGAISGWAMVVLVAIAYFVTGVIKPRENRIQTAADAAAKLAHDSAEAQAKLIVDAAIAANTLALDSAAAQAMVNQESALRNQLVDTRISDLLKAQEAVVEVQRGHERRLDSLEKGPRTLTKPQ